MTATERTLSNFLHGNHQFRVPVYQRTYSWTTDQCSQLWDDIVRAAKNTEISHHFIGSIVTIRDSSSTSETPLKSIIDGQQRITTVLLLMIALARKARESSSHKSEQIFEENLINKYNTGSLKYKLLLTQKDQDTFAALIEDAPDPEQISENIMNNFKFFEEKVELEDLEEVLAGTRKLIIVDISLEETRDDPQLIFESLNSTGLGLTQSDLIRNYLLMGLDPRKQEYIYNNYWLRTQDMVQRIPQGRKNYSSFDRFFRDYLAINSNGEFSKIDNIYTAFKKYYVEEEGGVEAIDTVVPKIYKYATFFTKISSSQSGDPQLDRAFTQLNELDIAVALLFLMSAYDNYETDKLMTKSDFLEVLQLVGSYLFRRFVCDLPSNSLTKVFLLLLAKVRPDNYLDSLKNAFRDLSGRQRFPNDNEFMRELIAKDFNAKYRAFLLGTLENYDRKEIVKIGEYTVEHIMPQTLTNDWEEMLGDDWEEIHDTFLHTIGNLTLTGYNSELSNKPFLEKKALEGGFDNSPLNLNKSLQNISVWNEKSIKERSRNLAKIAVKAFPSVDTPES